MGHLLRTSARAVRTFPRGAYTYNRLLLGFQGYAKVDVRPTLEGKPKVLEFFSNPDVKEILYGTYFFPSGFDDMTITELTWDQLKADTRAHKRRRVQHRSGRYENIHDVLTPFTSIEERKNNSKATE